MKISDMKKMFDLADEAIPIDEEKKRQSFEKIYLEFRKQRNPTAKKGAILLHLFQYMDKSVLYAYGILICLEIILMIIFQNSKIETAEIISFCMAGSGIISITAILFLDRVFFHKMAELGASCFFNTKQSIAAYMMIVESINLVMLLIATLYVSSQWKIAIVQFLIYILTPFLFSNVAAFGIIMTRIGQRNPFSLFLCGIFLSILYMILPTIPNVFLASSIWLWCLLCFIMAMVLAIEVKKYFGKVEKGELLCMN